MGKQKASMRDGAASRPAKAATTATAGDGSTPAKEASSTVPAPSAAMQTAGIAESAGWVRVRRSLLALMLIGAFAALSDIQAWKEGFMIAAPDHAPLLGMIAIFGVLVWRRWRRSGKQGLHPIYRVLGFLLMIVVGAALLPFNSTVTMYEVPFLSTEECAAVASAVEATSALPYFAPSRTRFNAQTEVPLKDLAEEISSFVDEALHERLLPFLRLQFLLEGVVVIEDDGVYVERYEAYQEPPPVAHIHERQLTVRVELTPTEQYSGGGVTLDSMGRSVQPAAGSALVLPAKLRHGSDDQGSGTRSVLVSTLSVKPASRWQRFVSIWRLWGLFSRRVRYVADRGLSSSGTDGIPGGAEDQEVVMPERGLDADGNDPLEF